MMRVAMIIVLCLLASCFVAFFTFCQISSHDLTITSMGRMELRIEQYIREHGVLPERIEDIPALSNRDAEFNLNTDAWGRDIMYSKVDLDRARLTSWGADGKPGGRGENEDIVRVHDYWDELHRAEKLGTD